MPTVSLCPDIETIHIYTVQLLMLSFPVGSAWEDGMGKMPISTAHCLIIT